jgi:hypothetical protein
MWWLSNPGETRELTADEDKVVNAFRFDKLSDSASESSTPDLLLQMP